MKKVFTFLGELRFQLFQAPLIVGYAIIAMIAYPVLFPVVILIQGIPLAEICDGWKAVMPFIIRIEVLCLFIVMLWVIWSMVRTITFFKKQKEEK